MTMERLCLGTAQFGMSYGINNLTGKPPKDQVFSMLDKAWDKGIRYLDTAFAYGDAEDLLGEYGARDKGFKLISKLKPNLVDDCLNPEQVVIDYVKHSLERLKTDSLEGYLLHTPEYIYHEKVLSALTKCQQEGLIKHIGVSAYEVQHALDAATGGIIDYIQVPYSVFDQRMSREGFFEVAKKNRVTVFARSAFLQGLILMESERIPEHLNIARDYLRDFDQIIQKYGYTRQEAALYFDLYGPDIDYVVFGVDNIAQLEEDIAYGNSKVDFSSCRVELEASFCEMEKSIIFPSLWSKRKYSAPETGDTL